MAEERRAREGAGAPAGPSRRGEASARTVHRPQGMHAGVPSRAAGNPWVLLHAFPTPPGMSTGRVGSILLLATISISPCCRARDHVTVPARWSCAGLGLRVLARSCAHGGKQVRLAFTLATWHASYAAVLADQRQNLRRPRTRSMHMQHTHAAAAAAAAMMQVGTTSDDPEKSIGHDNVPIPTCRELQCATRYSSRRRDLHACMQHHAV